MENRSTINIVVFISLQMLIPLEEKKEDKIGFFRNSEKLLALASGGHCYFPETLKHTIKSPCQMHRPNKICDLKIVQIKVTKISFLM